MIQIERPSGWTKLRVKRLALELKCIELYNTAANGNRDRIKLSWIHIK